MRKYSVVYDELGHKEGGIYCFLPFDNLDRYNKGVFKIGYAVSFRDRTEKYHTYFPTGVHIVAILESPQVRRPETKKMFYPRVEKAIIDYIEKHGGTRITSTARLNNETELVYTNLATIEKAFKMAETEYGGKAFCYHLRELQNERKRLMAAKHYTGEIIIPI
jgi:hypothetical protein